MIYLLALLIVPYACFVFCSECFNPFVRPKNPSKRKQWRTGRKMGLALLLGIVLTVVLFLTSAESLSLSIVMGIVIALALAVALSRKRISQYFFG